MIPPPRHGLFRRNFRRSRGLEGGSVVLGPASHLFLDVPELVFVSPLLGEASLGGDVSELGRGYVVRGRPGGKRLHHAEGCSAVGVVLPIRVRVRAVGVVLPIRARVRAVGVVLPGFVLSPCHF